MGFIMGKAMIESIFSDVMLHHVWGIFDKQSVKPAVPLLDAVLPPPQHRGHADESATDILLIFQGMRKKFLKLHEKTFNK
jgi:hypothetical protein